MCCLIGLVAAPVSAQTTTTYSYDALGRLTASTVTGSQNGNASTTIGYDAAGNRTSYKVSGTSQSGSTGSGSTGDNGSAQTPAFVVVPLNGFTIIPLG